VNRAMSDTGRIALAVAVPTFNEAETVGPLLDALQEVLVGLPDLTTTVLFIDDSSPDGTAKVIEGLQEDRQSANFRIRLLRRPRKEGLGRAYADGFSMLLAEGTFDYIVQMDADLSHHPRYIPLMLELARDAEFVCGSRYAPGGATPDWTWYRRLVSRAGNRYTRLFLGSGITDYTGGFNLFSVGLLGRIDVTSLRAAGYGFQIELKYRALRLANGVRQIPIVFMDRRVGQSKIPSNTIVKNLVLVPRIRLQAHAKSA
jgi:dolichol-phosphate mannosyltransferase